MEKQEQFSYYWRTVRGIVESIQEELALGNIDDMDVLENTITNWSSTHQDTVNSVSAYSLFTQSPNEWGEFLGEENIQSEFLASNKDLGELITRTVQSVVRSDVFAIFYEENPASIHILEGQKPKTKEIIVDGYKVLLRETWKNNSAILDRLPIIQIYEVDGLEVEKYRDGDDVIFKAKHKEEALCYLSESTEAIPVTIEDYESTKCATLLKYGFERKELWLSECTTTENFTEHYGVGTLCDLGLDKYKFVVYYHESGGILSCAGFNTPEEFEKACEHVGEYFK